jgi:hypothetical protein
MDVQVKVDETTLSIKIGNTYYQYSLDCIESGQKRPRHKLTKQEQELLERTLTGDLVKRKSGF